MFRSRTHRSLAATVVALVLVSSAAEARQVKNAAPPRVGDTAPDFTLAQIDGKKLTLSAELTSGPVVLIVGRGWVGYQCPFCNRQFGDFLRNAKELEAQGARVVWVYPGPTEDVQKRAEEVAEGRAFPPNFRFVLDPAYRFTLAYGLRWDAPQETAYPATFVIDRSRVVRFAAVSRTHGDRSTAAAVLTTLTGMNGVSGQIRGRVFDELGASIPDASVSFEPLDPRSGLTSFEAVADSRGRFDFARIRPGTYRITCKALGYETTVITQEVVAGVENDITVVVRRRSQQTPYSVPLTPDSTRLARPYVSVGWYPDRSL